MRCIATTCAIALTVITWQRGGLASGDEASEPPRRLELRPYAGWAAAPNSVVGALVGADVTLRVRRRWAIGADGAWYSPFEGAPPASDTRYPLNRTTWSASLDGFFSPLAAPPGERIGPGRIELFVFLGAGVVATRPVAVVDPSRRFEDNDLVQWNAGIGVHLYAGPGAALTLELRDLLYFDKIENRQIPDGQGLELPVYDPRNPANPSTWYSPYTRLTTCLELRVGGSFFAF